MSYEKLLAIAAEAAEHRRAERAEPPRICPHDATTLQAGPANTLHCPMGNYVWPRDGRPDLPN